jgi:hypothetical protein
MNIEKKKKRSAIKIEQYEKLVEKGRKKIELKEREYNNNKVSSLSNDIDNTKKQIIQEAGKFLETHLMPHLKDKICLQLKQSFKGVIKPIWIEIYSQPKWRQTKHRAAYRKAVEEKALTEYEQQYVNLHAKKVYHNANIQAIIDYYLGMTEEEKTMIFGKAKRRGADFDAALLEEAYNNILKIVKSLNDADIPALLADIRLVKKVLTKVADIALAEHEQRKRNKEITGQ